MHSQLFDDLEPEDAPYWELPISRHYHNKVADVFFSTLPRLRLAMLCLPSFEPEWSVCITVKGRTWSEYTLRFQEATEQIWMNPNPAADIPVTTATILIEPDLADSISDIWKLMLDAAQRPKTERIGLDGTSYHFMLWDQQMLTGKTWSPDENSKRGRLVSVCEALRDYALDGENRQITMANSPKLKLLRRLGTLKKILSSP